MILEDISSAEPLQPGAITNGFVHTETHFTTAGLSLGSCIKNHQQTLMNNGLILPETKLI